MSDKLKPCPCCGKKRAYIYGKYQVMCKCGMGTSVYSTEKYAIKKWNTCAVDVGRIEEIINEMFETIRNEKNTHIEYLKSIGSKDFSISGLDHESNILKELIKFKSRVLRKLADALGGERE